VYLKEIESDANLQRSKLELKSNSSEI